MKYTDNNFINKIIDLCKDEYKEKTFNINFNIQQLYALHTVLQCYLKEYLKTGQINGPSTIMYKSKNRKNKFYTYMVMNTKEKTNLFNFDDEKINNILKATMVIFIEVDMNNFKSINLKCFRINSKNEKIEKIISENVDIFFNKIVSDIEKIIFNIYNATYTKYGTCMYLGMINKELIGYYNTKYFELDAGGKCKYPTVVGKKIKMKYKYENMVIRNSYNDSNTEINIGSIYSNVIEKILELVLRTNFKSTNNQKYIDISLKEETSNQFELNKLILGETTILEDDFENVKINLENNESIVKLPKNIDDIIDKFFSLSNKKKEIFYNSCKSYEKALETKGMERLFHLFKAIENIVAYEEKYTNNLKDSRRKNIQNFIERYIRNRNFDGTIDWWYELRNKYAHNGIDYNGIFDLFFKPDFPAFRHLHSDKYFLAEDFLEAMVHFILLNWLKQN